MNRPQKATKEKICEAATQIIILKGAAQLTLEAVAEEAGISKGGLLYHFPNKEALLKGVVEHYALQFEKDIKQEEKAESGWLRAYIRASFKEDNCQKQLSAALFSVISSNPDLLAILKKQTEYWQDRINNDGLDVTMANLIRFAADGIWLSEVLGLSSCSNEDKQNVIERLLVLAKPKSST